MARGLVALSLLCFRKPKAALVACVGLLALSLTVAHAGLALRMDWTYLFYPTDKIVQSGQKFRESFPLPGDVAVLVDQGTPEERRVFIDRLAERMLAEPETFHHVLHRFDLFPLAPKALYYLDEGQLRQMLLALEALKSGERTEAIPHGAGKQVLLKLLSDLDQALETRGRAAYVPIWETLVRDEEAAGSNYLRYLLEDERWVYPTLGDGRVQVVAAKAGTFGQEFVDASPLVLRLRQILAELTPSTGNLRIRLTGLPVMLHDERETVSRDGARSTLVSLVLVVLVFALGFGELKRPVLAVLALCCGLGWTLGFATVAIGHLNFISVTLATMLMGVGIDFGIHFIFRYDEEMAGGRTPEQAIERTLAGTGVDTLVGATGTATAFLALTQAHFRGITDFGIIAAGGTMLCFLSTITVLPSLLALFPGQARRTSGSSAQVLWLENLLLSNARKVVLAWILLIIVACFYATQVGFSYNLLEVQAQEVSTVRTEIEMIRERNTVLSAEAISPDAEHARARLAEFEALPTVARVGSIVPLLPEIDAGKQALVERIVQSLKEVRLPERIQLETADDLLALSQRVRDLESSFPTAAGDPDVGKAVTDLRQDLAEMDPGPIQDGLAAFQEQLRQDLTQTLRLLKRQQAVPPRLEDLPAELRLRYVSQDGSFRQSIQPVKNIWHQDNLEEFLGQLKSVDPTVMGHPVIQDAILSAFHRTLDRTPWFTLAGVLLVFSLYLRRPRAIALSLLPASLAVLMIFATMGFLGMEFNVVNFVGLPISVGLGAVYGVHSMHRMRELGDETVLSSSTGPALLLSGVTDIVGFASLMIAHHRGISSLGLVISVGVGVSFIASLILLPTLRRVFRTYAHDLKTSHPSACETEREVTCP
jgi:hopanoid biosynthesis associated RND transporter like protein HpnN